MSATSKPCVRAAITVATAALLVLAAAMPAQARVQSFPATKERAGVATFRLSGVVPKAVRRAYVRVGNRRVRVSVRRLQRLPSSRVLRVRVQRRGTRGARRAARASGRRKLTVISDTTPPDTSITSGPEGTVTSGDAAFQLRASERKATFECSLDGGPWARCSSSPAYTGLVPGNHTFAARASDRSGNVDTSPATRNWSVAGSEPAPTTPTTTDPVSTTDPASGGDSEPSPGPAPLLYDDFSGPDGVITNQYAYWTTDPNAFRSPVWETESGSLLRRNGNGWTGVPDTVAPNIDSSNGNNSAIFRLWTKQSNLGDVNVRLALRNQGFTAGDSKWPARGWDGIKLMLRRSGESYYAIYVHTRDGFVAISKKCLGGEVQGGTYHTMMQSSHGAHAAPIGAVEQVEAAVWDRADGSVAVRLTRDGAVVAQATDAGLGCEPLRGPRGFGIRADNTEFFMDDLMVTQFGG